MTKLEQTTRLTSQDTTLVDFSQGLSQCSQIRLDVFHIQRIDVTLIEVLPLILQQVNENLTGEDNTLQGVCELLQSLSAFNESLVTAGTSLTLMLNDVIGFISLSAVLLRTIVSHIITAVTSHDPLEYPADQLKATWRSLSDFVLKLIGLIERYLSCDHAAVISSLYDVVISLANIGRDFDQVETKTMVLIYKCVLRLVSKEVGHYKSSEVLQKVIECVGQSTMNKLTQDDSQIQKVAAAKVTGFLLKIMSKLLSFTSDDIFTSWQPILDIIFKVSESLSDLMFGAAQSQSNLDVSLKSLLSACLPSAQFTHLVFQEALMVGKEEMALYVVSSIHECLATCKQIHPHWWASSAMEDLVKLLSICGNQLCLPLCQKNDVKNELRTTAYEFVVARLCAMMATTPGGDSFQNVEKLLLRFLLAPAVHLNIMAADCWHFVARYSPDRLPFIHCCKLVDMLKDHRLSDRQVLSVQNVLCRLVSLLQPDVQIDLVNYDGAFYSGVLAKCQFRDSANRAVEEVGLEYLKHHLGQLKKSGVTHEEIVYSLKSASRLLAISYECQEGVALSEKAANQLTAILIENSNNSSLESFVCLALQSFSAHRKLHQICFKVLHHLRKGFASRPLSIQKTMLDCLCKPSTLPAPQDKELLVFLYSFSISGQSMALSLHALQSFKTFAKSTPYQELINQIASHSPSVNSKIVQYCSMQTKDLKQFSAEQAPANQAPADQAPAKQVWNLSIFLGGPDKVAIETRKLQHSSVVYDCQPAGKKLRLDPKECCLNRLAELVRKIQQAPKLTDSQWEKVDELTSEMERAVAEGR